MPSKKLIETELEKMWDNYNETVVTIALHVFYAGVKPICEKNHWKFISGNGTWLLVDKAGDFKGNMNLFAEVHPEAKEIIDILNIIIPGSNQFLGSLMPDYDGLQNV